jgi:hypothetical protein
MIDHANYAHGTPEASRARIHEVACWAAIQAEMIMQCCELSDDAGTAHGIRRLFTYTKALIEEVCDQHEGKERDSE